jgi:undecaprenyl-diphosphatase
VKIYFLLLALIQGLTEFLPVSSSGHLALFEKIFGITSQRLSLIIYLHLATLLAIIVYFWKEINTALKDKRYLFYIFVAFIFTVLVAFPFKNFILRFFVNGVYLGAAFIVTAVFLILTDKVNNITASELKLSQVIIIGLAQGLAIIPGISRSGITIAAAVILGLNRDQAFKFSFLLAIPTLIAAGLYELKDISAFLNHTKFSIYFLSFILTFIAGLASLHILRKFLINKKLSFFGFYCCIIGVMILLTGGLK